MMTSPDANGIPLSLLALITSGAVGGAIGGLLGSFSKFFWERWLPDRLTWKRDQKARQRQLLATQRDPAVRAINELRRRLATVLKNNAHNYAYTVRLGRGDYYVESTAFLIAQYFAWSEVMRSFIAALDYSELSSLLDSITKAFSRGRPGFQFFRLEQREIGERLTASRKPEADTATFRFSDFRDLLNKSPPDECVQRLLKNTRELFHNLDAERFRAASIHNSLVDLLDFVDPEHRWVSPGDRGRILESQDAPSSRNSSDFVSE
jgi:Fe-S-cluster formation regulator IscX/YfhJ